MHEAVTLTSELTHTCPLTLSLLSSAFWGYVGGLGLTIAVMNLFQAAQPALLYIVPAVLAAVGLHAHLRGEFKQARCTHPSLFGCMCCSLSSCNIVACWSQAGVVKVIFVVYYSGLIAGSMLLTKSLAERQVLNHSEDANDAKDKQEAKSAAGEIASVSAALAGGLPGRKHE